jgi:hypothetical protein
MVPSAALFYAVDVKALLKRGATEYHKTELDTSAGQWLFFVGVFAVIVAGSLAMYWEELGTFAILALVSVILAAGLYGLNERLLHRPAGAAGVPKLQSHPAHR